MRTLAWLLLTISMGCSPHDAEPDGTCRADAPGDCAAPRVWALLTQSQYRDSSGALADSVSITLEASADPIATGPTAPLGSCSDLLDAGAPPGCDACTADQHCVVASDGTGSCADGPPPLTNEDVGPVRVLLDGQVEATMRYSASECSQVAGCYADDDFTSSGRWMQTFIGVGHEIAIAGDGAGALGPFAASLDGYDAIVLPDHPPSLEPFEIADGVDLPLAWNPGDAHGTVSIAVGGPQSYFVCTAPDEGTFTLPAAKLDPIVDSAAGEATVFVRRERVLEVPLPDRALLLDLRTEASFSLAPPGGGNPAAL